MDFTPCVVRSACYCLNLPCSPLVGWKIEEPVVFASSKVVASTNVQGGHTKRLNRFIPTKRWIYY